MPRRFSFTVYIIFIAFFFAMVEPSNGAQRSKSVKVGKQKAWISHSSQGPGLYTQMIIIQGGRSEIQVDQNGDGFADHLEYSNGKRTVHASDPVRGQFLRLEVTQRERNGMRHLDYALTPGRRTYKLVQQRFEPYQNVFYNDDLELGPLCEEDTLKGMRDWLAILAMLGQDPEKDLITKLSDPADTMIDKSCKTGVFKSATPQISKALSQIMLSPQKNGNAGFLKCLRENDLGIHAARIESAFAKAANPDGKPLIKCAHWADKSQHGSYRQATEEIFLHQPSYEPHQCRGGDPTNQYSETLMHELLHRSQIMDEKMVGHIQRCCGRGAEGDAASCKSMRETIAQEKLSRAYDSLLYSRYPEYPGLRARILSETRSTERGKDMLDDYFKEFDKTLAASLKEKEKCGSGPKCESAQTQKLDAFNDKFFKRKCSGYFESRRGETRKICDEYRDAFNKLIKSPAEAEKLYAESKEIVGEKIGPNWYGHLADETAEEATDVPADLRPGQGSGGRKPLMPPAIPLEDVYGPPPAPDDFVGPPLPPHLAQPKMPPAAPPIDDYWDEPYNPIDTSETAGPVSAPMPAPPAPPAPQASPVPVPTMDEPAFNSPPERSTASTGSSNFSMDYSTPDYSREYVMYESKKASEEKPSGSTSAQQPSQAAAPRASAPAPAPEKTVSLDLDDTKDIKNTLKLYESRQSALEYLTNSAFKTAFPAAGAQQPQGASDLPNPFYNQKPEKGADAKRLAKTKGGMKQDSGQEVEADSEEDDSEPSAVGNVAPGAQAQIARSAPNNWRSRGQLVTFLAGRYEQVRSQLGKPELASALRSHGVRLTDDQGRTFGPVDAAVQMRYSATTKRLEIVKSKRTGR